MTRRDDDWVARAKRAPVIIGCSALYILLAAPLRITARASQLSGAGSMAVLTPSLLSMLTLALVYTGFGLAAWGDWHKSVTKASSGPDTLVTSGPFRWFRHPNYTGEILGWTANVVLALVEAVVGAATIVVSTAIGPFRNFCTVWIIASVLGWMGILGVLIGATTGLEKKQEEKYGGTLEYEAWLKTS